MELRAKWIAAVRRSHWNPTCRSVVCARHLLSSDCRKDNRIVADESVNLFDSFRKRLLPTTIPSVNLTPQESISCSSIIVCIHLTFSRAVNYCWNYIQPYKTPGGSTQHLGDVLACLYRRPALYKPSFSPSSLSLGC